MTSLKPPSLEKVQAARERIGATGQFVLTDLYVLAASMWSMAEDAGLLDDPRCELARAATRAAFSAADAAYRAETGKSYGDYVTVLTWQAAKDDESAANRARADLPGQPA